MSLSLIGIIVVQIYWITNSIRYNDEQFSFAVKQTMVSVATELENREIGSYQLALQNLKDTLGGNIEPGKLRRLLLAQQNRRLIENSTLHNNPLIEDYKLDPQLTDLDLDSITFKRLFDSNGKLNRKEENASTDNKIRYSELDNFARKVTGERASEYFSILPLPQRVSIEEVYELIKLELEKRQIEARFEFAIYQDGFATRVQSPDFTYVPDATWDYPIYRTSYDTVEPYYLYISLPQRKKVILSSIMGMALLSLVFTTVIVVAYSSAINQIFKQRQISQIKTDFINNMTHEFKTPIATINLALDSLNHPKISSDPEKVKNYLRMIREENKRMHGQVENVLQISKLEKNDLNLSKERVEMNELINDSITHVQLLLEEKNGTIKTHLGALRTVVLANESHMTNVIVNILENAIKYTESAPIIDVYTENVKNKLVIKVRDQGIGMGKAAQRKAFQKFFREHTGDIHNVKGHGLGLAYSKRILEDHEGEIYVQSVKGKGSTFSIHLPLIV
ncbi:sensor histidine kinase [Nonlabens marinus]|uniref:histidine kinase n=1 Tax=Nonlabens marinus S1-08 TaxID=1454201 RepID=W8VQT7_9FLAO|nr:HAMP domain-containing sensor histidine kinase [Nonlabens marinus]BAO55889.1 two-component system sensor histidine kinase [Nonlabens marinus S1-08]